MSNPLNVPFNGTQEQEEKLKEIIEGRKEILKIHTENMSLDKEADVDLLATLTEGLSGADLKAVCTEAGMFAIREKRDAVTIADFMDAVDKIMDSDNDDEFVKEAGVMFG